MSARPLLGLASRWLREQLATDHRADERIDQIELDARREAQRSAGDLLLPGVRRHAEEARARREAHELAEEEARRRSLPRVEGCTLRLAGDLEGSLPSRLAVDVELDGDLLLITMEHDGGVGQQDGEVPFEVLALAVPGYGGDGSYDLRAAHAEDWDPLWFALVADVEDEHFVWEPAIGPCTATIHDGHLELEIAFADVASRRVLLTGGLPLPL